MIAAILRQLAIFGTGNLANALICIINEVYVASGLAIIAA